MSQFSGSLANKRKADLQEIANALHLGDIEGTMIELRERIQSKLDQEAQNLRNSDMFKGLYSGRRTKTSDESDTPVSSEKTPARRRINKAVDRLAEAANIPLPDSPLGNRVQEAGAKIQEAADSALTLVDTDAKELSKSLGQFSTQVTKFVNKHKGGVEGQIRKARNFLSHPDGLIPVAIIIEEAFLIGHVTHFNKHNFEFPPPSYESGSLAALLRLLFFWMPTVSWTVVLPQADFLMPRSPVWPAFAWWFVATIVPPLILSTVVSFVPQKGGSRSSRSKHSGLPTPTIDDLTYALFRFAILLIPLTDVAPKFTDALNVSGNPAARALGAGLLAALVFAYRVTSA